MIVYRQDRHEGMCVRNIRVEKQHVEPTAGGRVAVVLADNEHRYDF